MPWAPSFPLPTGGGLRLYPAEAVGTAIEVKSDIAAQWDEVVRKANTLAMLRQQLGGASVDDSTGAETVMVHPPQDEPIPFYAVGYEGWKTPERVKEHLQDTPLDGILIIKPQIFAWSDRKEHLARVAEWEAELIKKRCGEKYLNPTKASCARVLELQQEALSPEELASRMNSEDYETGPLRFSRDHEALPTIGPGEWDAHNVRELLHMLCMKVEVVQGIPAFLQFIAVIHREVAKRATMMADLSRYAT
jgi:hypothetical protein